MIGTYVLNHSWIPALAWILLYTSDYYLTLWGARLYKSQEFMKIEGSYELTPQYQKDVDSQRRVSPRMVAWLVSGAVILFVAGIINPDDVLYRFLVGFWIFPELVVNMRHVANISQYRELNSQNPGATGSITFSRSFTYRGSAVSLGTMAALALLFYLLTWNSFFLGGGISLMAYARQHAVLAKRCRSAVVSAE